MANSCKLLLNVCYGGADKGGHLRHDHEVVPFRISSRIVSCFSTFRVVFEISKARTVPCRGELKLSTKHDRAVLR
jgi:hypothetical protein